MDGIRLPALMLYRPDILLVGAYPTYFSSCSQFPCFKKLLSLIQLKK